MNPLESLKQKLKVKPIVEEKERVAVIIKGNNKKPEKPKKDQEELEEFVPEVEDIVKNPSIETIKPLIVDQTDKGYDRLTLLKKLQESKMSKVSIKPFMKEAQEQQIVPPILPPKKRAKKVNLPLIIEEEDDEPIVPQKKKLLIIEDIEEEEKKEPDIIPIVVPEKKERKTKNETQN
jgi:hypothetical protein